MVREKIRELKRQKGYGTEQKASRPVKFEFDEKYEDAKVPKSDAKV